MNGYRTASLKSGDGSATTLKNLGQDGGTNYLRQLEGWSESDGNDREASMFSKKPGDTEPAEPAEHLARGPAVTTSAGPVSAKPIEQQRVAFRYVDRPECAETFADSIIGLLFDGQSLRIEFGVSRLDEKKPDAPLTGRRYPACRLVLSPAAAIDLINKMQQVAAGLSQAGLVKAMQVPAEPNTR